MALHVDENTKVIRQGLIRAGGTPPALPAWIKPWRITLVF